MGGGCNLQDIRWNSYSSVTTTSTFYFAIHPRVRFASLQEVRRGSPLQPHVLLVLETVFWAEREVQVSQSGGFWVWVIVAYRVSSRWMRGFST